MKTLTLIAILLTITSCAGLKRRYVPLAERRMECIERMLMMDVEPTKASEICNKVHHQR